MARIKSNQIQELPLETKVNLKGRIILKRDFGKRVFYTLKDDEGLVQVSLERGSFETEEDYKELKKGLSIGDIVSLDGMLLIFTIRCEYSSSDELTVPID